ncbi:MAG: hypothetical protein EHM24_11260 [Acidobacteria bacterium]|nr:MAG: hypothetical protein EHM24_11260 [Acidobacteriota bacterium]
MRVRSVLTALCASAVIGSAVVAGVAGAAQSSTFVEVPPFAEPWVTVPAPVAHRAPAPAPAAPVADADTRPDCDGDVVTFMVGDPITCDVNPPQRLDIVNDGGGDPSWGGDASVAAADDDCLHRGGTPVWVNDGWYRLICEGVDY